MKINIQFFRETSSKVDERIAEFRNGHIEVFQTISVQELADILEACQRKDTLSGYQLIQWSIDDLDIMVIKDGVRVGSYVSHERAREIASGSNPEDKTEQALKEALESGCKLP